MDGYTDSVGSEDYNMTLSENRAQGVQSYLIGEGIAPDDIISKGFGKDDPVASNDTAAGRQKNRRVEMVVSGDIIGTPIGARLQLGQINAVARIGTLAYARGSEMRGSVVSGSVSADR